MTLPRPTTTRSRRGRLRAAVLAGALLAAGTGALAPPAQAATASPLPASAAVTWGTDGRVAQVLVDQGRVLVAGQFGALVGPSGENRAAGNVALYDPASGTFDPDFSVSTDGAVLAMATDGSTLWLGGEFTKVDGQKRGRLAAVSLDTGAVTSWAPSAAGFVNVLQLVGDELLVGGGFTGVTAAGGTSGPYLARLTTGGSLSAVHVPQPDGPVRAAVTSLDGSAVYLGGDFGVMDGNGSAARRVARLDAATGALDPAFRSGPTNGTNRAPAIALAVDATRVYVAAGGGGGACAGLDARTGASLWSQKANGDMQGVEVIGDVVYCGGHFGGTGAFAGVERQKIAAVDAATGSLLSWAPRVNSALGVWTMATDGTTLFVGGDFDRFGPTSVRHLAQVVPPAAQTVPTAVGQLVGTAYDGRVELTWAAPSSDGGRAVSAYAVTRRTGTRTTTLATALKTPQFVDTGVVDGVTYSYTVTARNGIGTSVGTTTPALTPAPGPATTPRAPRDVLATAGQDKVSLAWQTPAASGGSPVTGYRVYRATGGGTPTLVTTTDAATRSWTDGSAAGGTTYTYSVAAQNAVGTGGSSSSLPVTPTSGVPSTPTLTATAASQPAPQVTLSWTVPAGAAVTKYVVVRDGIRLTTITATSPTSGGLVDTAVRSGSSYRYQVKAVGPTGASPLSKAVTIRVP